MAPHPPEKEKAAKKSAARMTPTSSQEGPSQGTSKRHQVIRRQASKQKEEPEDGIGAKQHPSKCALLSMLTTLRNKWAPQQTSSPDDSVSHCSSTSSFFRGFQIFSPSRRSGLQAASAKNDAALKQRVSDVIEEVGSRLNNMTEILKSTTPGSSNAEGSKESFQTIVGDLRAALSETEEMTAEVVPLIAENMSTSELQQTLKMMIRKLLEIRELLKTGPNHGGGFSNLDVQLAFIDARRQLRKAQDVSAKLGPLPIVTRV